MSEDAILEVDGVQKTYGKGEQAVRALAGVSFAIPKGQFTAIMGPSGSGKSTLLHLIGGLDRPSAGRVRVAGEALEGMSDGALSALRRRRIGFIFQFFHLLPTLTALENVCLPMLLDGKPFGSVAAKARELLTLMKLEHRMDHRPSQLSGGEMQRVAIARALIADPALILADEPTGNLDTKTGQSILDLLGTLHRERGYTIVMVTHDPAASRQAQRVVALRDGLVAFDGAPSAHA
jgi:putative ABC transport system ATP-binding protein